MERLHSAENAVTGILTQTLLRATLVSDLASQDPRVQELTFAHRTSGDDASLRRVQRVLLEFEKNTNLGLVELINPEGDVILSTLGIDGRVGGNVASWAVVEDTNEMRTTTSLVVIGGRLFALASANIRVAGNVAGVLVVGYEVNLGRLQEWAGGMAEAATLGW